MQRHSAYLVCGTTHGWTDATASRQIATTLTDAYDYFTRQAVDPGIALVSQARPFPFHSTDRFQYRYAEEGSGSKVLSSHLDLQPSKTDVSSVVAYSAYSGTRTECQNDRVHVTKQL